LTDEGHAVVTGERSARQQRGSPSVVAMGGAWRGHGPHYAGVRLPTMGRRFDVRRRDRWSFCALQPAARHRDTARAHDRTHGDREATARQVARVQGCNPSGKASRRAQPMQACGDAPPVVPGATPGTTIFELRRERLFTEVAERPLPSTVCAHEAVRMRVHEHQARIELAEPQLVGQRVSRQGPCICQDPEYVIKRDQPLRHLAFRHLCRIRRRAADRYRKRRKLADCRSRVVP
jgi:hypothetical protein